MKQKKLEEAKRLYQTANADQRYVLESLFPELQESEGERIKKNCIHFLELQKSHHAATFEIEECIAWIKKQCEHKSCNSIELNFNVGGWIIFAENHNSIYQVEKMDNYRYYLRHYLGGTLSVHFDNELIRPWDIVDAKDGDVLYSLDSNEPFIYKCRNYGEQATCYCGINKFGKFFIWNTKDCIITLDKYVPATQEQRDLLFQKMKEAGYMWDAEKKDLRKRETSPVLSNSLNIGKVAQKFKVGDWVVTDKNNVVQIKTIENCKYVLENTMRFSIDYVDKYWRKWNISDAKDGDVLCYETKDELRIFIYKNGHVHYHCCYYNGHLTTVDSYFIVEKYLLCYIHPATIKQRDLLFAKMREAGYEWDTEKKELRKIEKQ